MACYMTRWKVFKYKNSTYAPVRRPLWPRKYLAYVSGKLGTTVYTEGPGYSAPLRSRTAHAKALKPQRQLSKQSIPVKVR